MSQQSQSHVSSPNGASDPAASPILAVLDGHALFHRSFHAFPEEMSTGAGVPINAVFGFTRMLLDVYRIIRPDYLVMTFDRPTPTFRHKAYVPYKAHRPSLPDGMRAQFKSVREVVAAFGMPIFEVDGYEADDLIGTLARQATEKRVRTVIATGDLDTLQLVNDWVRVTFARTPRRGEFDYFDVPAIIARYGFGPEHIVDYKALVGDTSDNIPGVPGVGAKTASKLIQEYGSLEDILAHLADLPARTQSLLETHRDQAIQSKYLATIVTDAPITLDLEAARALDYDADRVMKVFHEFEFYSLVEKLPRRADAGMTTVAAPASQAPAQPAAQAEGDGAAQLSLFAEDELQAITEEGVSLAPGTSAPRLAIPAAPQTTNTLVIDTPEALDVLARALASAPLFAFDTETDTTDEMTANLVGLSFAIGAGEAYYIPVGHGATSEGEEPARQLPLKDVIERLRPALTDPKVGKTAHNAKFDMMAFARRGVWIEGLVGDTLVAADLLHPGRRGLGLKELAFENLGVIMTPISDLIGTGRKQITMAQVPIRTAADYAGADADMALRLHLRLDPQLAGRGVERLYREIELPLIPVLARMELTGMLIDPPFLQQMATQLDEQLNALSSAIYASVGHEFNLNSPKQLGEVLFNELKLPSGRKTKTGYSVDAAIVEGLRGMHEMVDLLLEYRQLSKLKSTYVDGLLELVSPTDHRVHTSFNQTIAATGRLSSSNPNLQNIPIRTEVGRRIRRAFLADPGMYLLTADYSQIELRILAHITHEPALVAAFLADEDIHAATAAQLFKIPLAEVRPEQRRLAKTVNFAVLYGQSAFGLANVTGMTNAEAVEFIRTYEKTFPKVREYVESTLLQARTQGFVQTLLGRRRYVPPDMATLPLAQRQAVEREAINMPIQGTNADMIKIAMVRLDERIRERRLGSRMILQVHDELVLEAMDSEVEAVGPLVIETMTNALPLDVPVKVELKLGRNWYDVQPLQTSAGTRS
ncbi:MAG TPA: DNA polymerase I [Ktedonobacterales bacterium]|nr:DNA polymerase I [Ktedonobacterales bacterium]